MPSGSRTIIFDIVKSRLVLVHSAERTSILPLLIRAEETHGLSRILKWHNARIEASIGSVGVNLWLMRVAGKPPWGMRAQVVERLKPPMYDGLCPSPVILSSAPVSNGCAHLDVYSIRYILSQSSLQPLISEISMFLPKVCFSVCSEPSIRYRTSYELGLCLFHWWTTECTSASAVRFGNQKHLWQLWCLSHLADE